jgi:nitrogen fixation NifU-like protein
MADIYRQHILDRYHTPQFRGALNDASLEASEANPLCGDKVSMQLKLENDKIVTVAWCGEGCAVSLAAADILSEAVVGMTIEQAKSVTSDKMIALLGVDFGPARWKCATLALMALHKIE